MIADRPAVLAQFASTLRFEDLPSAVVDRAEDLMLDWLGSALAVGGPADGGPA